MANKLKSKYKEPDIETANQMLTNIFEELNLQTPSKPLEVMSSYAVYRKERYVLQQAIVIGILVIFMLIPLLFISPRFTMTPVDTVNDLPVYEIRLKHAFPVSSITATVGDYAFAVTDLGNQVYRVQPTVNGTLTVRVKYINTQYREKQAEIAMIDSDPPTITATRFEDGRLYLSVSDEGTGIDYEAVYALSPDNERLSPESYDETTGTIVFNALHETMSIFIPDLRGNELYLVLTLK